eukprot:scaffold20865_cov150-Skeletonema_marinoi.AAC.1
MSCRKAQLDLSDQLRGCIIASSYAIRLRSANEPAGQLNWTSQISYEVIASLHHTQSICIAAKCNGPLEAAHAFIDDDRYDVVE